MANEIRTTASVMQVGWLKGLEINVTKGKVREENTRDLKFERREPLIHCALCPGIN